jgi:hypothetical protein
VESSLDAQKSKKQNSRSEPSKGYLAIQVIGGRRNLDEFDWHRYREFFDIGKHNLHIFLMPFLLVQCKRYHLLMNGQLN